MKANRIDLFGFKTPAMRAFHVTWVSFFLCFFGWFGVAPLMPVIRKELSLSSEEIGNIVIASVAATVLARLGVGWLCDRFGPRRVYAGLLALGALPVMGIGLADDYASFLAFRLAIGAIGAASSSPGAIPSSAAYERWRSISVRAVAWSRSAKRASVSRSGARAAASPNIRQYSTRNR